MKTDENLNLKDSVNGTSVRLNKSKCSLQIRNFVNVNTLKFVYYAIFDSHTNCESYIGVKLYQKGHYSHKLSA